APGAGQGGPLTHHAGHAGPEIRNMRVRIHRFQHAAAAGAGELGAERSLYDSRRVGCIKLGSAGAEADALRGALVHRTPAGEAAVVEVRRETVVPAGEVEWPGAAGFQRVAVAWRNLEGGGELRDGGIGCRAEGQR